LGIWMTANTRWVNPNGNNSKRRSRQVNKMEDISARSMGLYIPSKNSTSILKSLSSQPLASFHNGPGCTLLQHPTSPALLTPPTPCQREFVCGVCIGTAQVGASLVAPLEFIFKRSICMMTIHASTLWTPPWYATL